LDQKETKKPFTIKINKLQLQKKILDVPNSNTSRQNKETQEKIHTLKSILKKE